MFSRSFIRFHNLLLVSGAMQKVEVSYKGRNWGFGTFDTLEQAVIINEIVRGTLQATKKFDLTKEEIEGNVKLAKEGAVNALSELPRDTEMTDTSRKEEAVSNAVSKLIRSSLKPPPEEEAEEEEKMSMNARMSSYEPPGAIAMDDRKCTNKKTAPPICARATVKARNPRKKACGKCEECLLEDCGQCKACVDKPKFGGPGIKKQKCLKKVCTNSSRQHLSGHI